MFLFQGPRKKKASLGLLLWLVLAMCFPFPANAEDADIPDSIHVVTPEWPGFTNADGTGLYFDLLHRIYEPVGIKVKYKFVPWARAVAYVNLRKSDALLGSYNTVDAFFPKYPLDTERTAIVFKKAKIREWNGEESIKGKHVAWVRGYNYHKYLNVKVKYTEVNRSEQGWKMLMLDRLDFFMNSLKAINRYVEQNRIDLQHYQFETVLVKKLYMRFSKTEKSKVLIEIFDKRMMELEKAGEIKKLFKKWDFPYPDFNSVSGL